MDEMISKDLSISRTVLLLMQNLFCKDREAPLTYTLR